MNLLKHMREGEKKSENKQSVRIGGQEKTFSITSNIISYKISWASENA